MRSLLANLYAPESFSNDFIINTFLSLKDHINNCISKNDNSDLRLKNFYLDAKNLLSGTPVDILAKNAFGFNC